MLTLTPAELRELTGYRRPAEQLDELRRRGFYRARRSHTGSVILERAHYIAVCGGLCEPSAPKVKPPKAESSRHKPGND